MTGQPPRLVLRFTQAEVAKMEELLRDLNAMPKRPLIQGLTDDFNASPDRSDDGKVRVKYPQVRNWFQNRRSAQSQWSRKMMLPPVAGSYSGNISSDGGQVQFEAKSATNGAWYDVAAFLSHRFTEMRDPEVLVRFCWLGPEEDEWIDVCKCVRLRSLQCIAVLPGDLILCVKGIVLRMVASSSLKQSHQEMVHGMQIYIFPAFLFCIDCFHIWFDVAAIQSCRFSETGDQEVQLWFSGFGAEEEEWINVCKSVRLRSLPCVATECVDVLPGDLILCYQEGKERALYFDAHVLEVERRTHDIRGCSCSFLVCYDHDHSEEIVPLRKVCRRPSADVKIDIVVDHSLAEQKTQKTHKRMDMNPGEITVVPSPPDQGGPSDKLAAPLLITTDRTHRDLVADVQMGDIEAATKIEATSKAHGDKMNARA